jgi:hypothetical protein
MTRTTRISSNGFPERMWRQLIPRVTRCLTLMPPLWLLQALVLPPRKSGCIECQRDITIITIGCCKIKYFLLLSQHVFHIRFPVSDRWLHPISIPELYEMYELHHQGKPVSSASVFRSELKRWRSVLKIRQVGQHARCMTCTLTPYQAIIILFSLKFGSFPREVSHLRLSLALHSC